MKSLGNEMPCVATGRLPQRSDLPEMSAEIRSAGRIQGWLLPEMPQESHLEDFEPIQNTRPKRKLLKRRLRRRSCAVLLKA